MPPRKNKNSSSTQDGADLSLGTAPPASTMWGNMNAQVAALADTRQAYRWPDEGCVHFNKESARGGGGKKKGGGGNVPRSCDATDARCLNGLAFGTLPAESNWPTGRLKAAVLGPEPPMGPCAEDGSVQPPSGIPNLGNTCYANAILQCLARVGMGVLAPSFIDFFLAGYDAELKPPAVTAANAVAVSSSTDASATTSPARNADAKDNNGRRTARTEDGAALRASPVNNNKNKNDGDDDQPAVSSSAAAAASSSSNNNHDEAESYAANLLRFFFSQLRLVYGGRVDLAPVMRALAINVTVQQDSQEFYVLLLGLIERAATAASASKMLAASPVGNSSSSSGSLLAKTLKSALIGHMLNVKTCLACNGTTEHADEISYGGLQLSVMPTLEESVLRFIEVENGGETFNCEKCNGKGVNFTTQLRLKKLPPVVMFHLMRFRYDMRTFNRIKVHDTMRLPETINLGELVVSGSGSGKNAAAAAAPTSGVYRMQCAVLHKGQSAMHGHYVAMVRGKEAHGVGGAGSESTWWLMDDERATRIQKNPFQDLAAVPQSRQQTSSATYGSNHRVGGDNAPHAEHGTIPGAVLACPMSKKQRRAIAMQQKEAFAAARLEQEAEAKRQQAEGGGGAAASNKADDKKGDEDAAVVAPAAENDAKTDAANATVSEDAASSAAAAAKDTKRSSGSNKPVLHWASDEVFMVWYVRVDNETAAPEVDGDNAAFASDGAAAAAAAADGTTNSKSSGSGSKPSTAVTTCAVAGETDTSVPERTWPQLAARTRVSQERAVELRKRYETQRAAAETLFDAWRATASFLARDNHRCWADGVRRDALYAVPTAWLLQLRAASVRDSDFNEEDTTADLTNRRALFARARYAEILCTDATHGLADRDCINPRAAYRLVSKEFYDALCMLREMVHASTAADKPKHRDVEAMLLTSNDGGDESVSPMRKGNDGPVLPPAACPVCVRHRIEDLRSNRQHEERFAAIKAEAVRYDKQSMHEVVDLTAKGIVEKFKERSRTAAAAASSSKKSNKSKDAAAAAAAAAVADDDEEDESAMVRSRCPLLVASAVVDKLRSASDVDSAKRALAGEQLVSSILCTHKRVAPGAAYRIVPRAVHDYLVDEMLCVNTGVEMPLWSVSKPRSKKQQNSNDGEDDEEEEEDDEDADEDVDWKCYESVLCETCGRNNTALLAAENEHKVQRSAARNSALGKLIYTTCKKYDSINERYWENDWTKRDVNKWRTDWRAQEKKRIAALAAEEKKKADQEAKTAASGFKAQKAGGSNNNNASNNNGDAAVAADAVDPMQPREPPVLVRTQYVLPGLFIRRFKAWVEEGGHGDGGGGGKKNKKDKDDEKSGSGGSKFKLVRPCVDDYYRECGMRCEQHGGALFDVNDLKYCNHKGEKYDDDDVTKPDPLHWIVGDDVIDYLFVGADQPFFNVEALQTEMQIASSGSSSSNNNAAASSSSQNRGKQSNNNNNTAAVASDAPPPTVAQLRAAALAHAKQRLLVKVVWLDDAPHVEPDTCGPCNEQARIDAVSRSVVYEDGLLDVFVPSYQAKKKITSDEYLEFGEFSSSSTINDVLVQVHATIKDNGYRVLPDESALALSQMPPKWNRGAKHNEGCVALDGATTLFDAGVLRRGTKLVAFIRPEAGDNARVVKFDKEEDDLQAALAASMADGAPVRKNNWPGAPSSSRAEPTAFQGSRLAGASAATTLRNDDGEEVVACGACTYHNPKGARRCEVCENPL